MQMYILQIHIKVYIISSEWNYKLYVMYDNTNAYKSQTYNSLYNHAGMYVCTKLKFE